MILEIIQPPEIHLEIIDNENIELSVNNTVLNLEILGAFRDGKNGKDGKTPQKGVDYFDGVDGNDGKTPIKGVDYFDGNDGQDGYTPIKGVDYFDGKDGSDATVTFATQSEAESQTPPDTENNKAVSLFGLWKWVKKLNYLYLNITTANSTLNKIWYDGINTWVTNKDGVNKQLAYDGDTVRRIDGTFNPPTQAQLTSLGIKRGDFYQNTTTNQRAMYNGNQLVEWTVTTAEYNALSSDQKNAVKNLSIIVI